MKEISDEVSGKNKLEKSEIKTPEEIAKEVYSSLVNYAHENEKEDYQIFHE